MQKSLQTLAEKLKIHVYVSEELRASFINEHDKVDTGNIARKTKMEAKSKQQCIAFAVYVCTYIHIYNRRSSIQSMPSDCESRIARPYRDLQSR